MTCEKCGNTGHSGKSCSFTQEDENSFGNDTPNDTNCRPQQERRRRSVADEQFGKFIEVIEKLYGNIPLLDTMQVPTYAKYLKDILGNKRVLPITKVVQLTYECSTAILNPLLEKKKKPGCPTITCSIGAQHFKHALCDLRASISVMPKMEDLSVHYPMGIAENIPVKIWNFFVPIDFVILDMEVDNKTPLILGRPFLSMTNAYIDAGVGVIQLNINGQKERFGFRPKDEQCSQIKSINRKEFVKELEKPSTPSNYTLIEFVENLRTREEIKVYNQRNAKRNIQRKKFLEFGKKEIEITLPMAEESVATNVSIR
ncbi:uncharacterized protein LOC120695210 [Panicum virgatum]|uniref:uncharacterized protein LOC120695210 n=1 Tax=Panicum virgatum TaxID=38727 RepID=UPI0019D678A1|nr:uncharacterized protein LOC120695210 [Panicum virgatum]